jgi:hypothetical protein
MSLLPRNRLDQAERILTAQRWTILTREADGPTPQITAEYPEDAQLTGTQQIALDDALTSLKLIGWTVTAQDNDDDTPTRTFLYQPTP